MLFAILLLAVAESTAFSTFSVVCDGPLSFQQAFDNRCNVINGDLISDSTTVTGNFSLPELREVTGRIQVLTASGLISLEFPALESADWVYVSANSALTALDLRSLVSVGTLLDVASNSALTALDLRSLVSVGSLLNVAFNSALTVLNLGALSSVGAYLYVTDNLVIDCIIFPQASPTIGVAVYVELATYPLKECDMPSCICEFSVGSCPNGFLTTECPAL